jgi:hypothetical protein
MFFRGGFLVWVTHLESAMNIELEEVVQDVSDEALELAAGGAQGGLFWTAGPFGYPDDC